MSIRQIVIFVSIICMIACNSNEPPKNEQIPHPPTNNPAEDPSARLKDFYSAYIAERAQAQEDTGRISNLFREYCTDSFANHLKAVYAHGELEADPIVDAQDVDQSWIKTLSVQKNGIDDFLVCYVDTYDNQKRCLNVFVVNVDGKWRINDVIGSM